MNAGKSSSGTPSSFSIETVSLLSNTSNEVNTHCRVSVGICASDEIEDEAIAVTSWDRVRVCFIQICMYLNADPKR